VSNHRKLTPRKLAFISAYLSGRGGAESAIAAGYSPGNARHRAYELLNNDPLVMQAVADARDKLLKESNYGSERAMQELDEKIRAATAANQFSAVARFVELKMKMVGLLTEKKEAAQSNLTLNIVGVDMAKAETPTIEVTTEIFN
jgi:phage terminase small subunit